MEDALTTNTVNQPASQGPTVGSEIGPFLASDSLAQQSLGRNLQEGIEVFDTDTPLTYKDAQDIAGLFAEIYREYDDHVLNEPHKIVDLVAEGKWIAFIKRNEEGELIGHGALLDNGKGVFDIGRLVVSPKAQGMNIASKITKVSMDYAADPDSALAVTTIQAETVTTHPFSQKVYEKHGFVPTGLHLNKFTQFFDDGDARESVLIKTKVLDAAAREHREVFLPSAYQALVEEVYANLDCEREIKTQEEVSQKNALPSKALVSIDNCDLEGFGLSIIEAHAELDVLELLTMSGAQKTLGAEFIEIKLDMSQPESIQQALALKAAGYVFAGVEVNRERDLLIMQYSEGIGAHSDKGLILNSELGKKLASSLIDIEFRECSL